MPYDLTHFITYLENTSPSEIVRMMDNAMHDKVLDYLHQRQSESKERQEAKAGIPSDIITVQLYQRKEGH